MMKQVISDMRSLSLRLDISLTTNDLSATSKRPRANVEEIESSTMDVIVVESAVTPQDDAQFHAQSRIHQNVFDTMMAASSVRTGMIVINKDTTIIQLLQLCVECKVLNSVNALGKLATKSNKNQQNQQKRRLF